MLNPHERVAVLFDTQNLYHAAQSLGHRRIDYGYLLNYIVQERIKARAIAYAIQSDTSQIQPFVDVLNQIGIETRVKDLLIFPDGKKKGDWDMGIAMDAIGLAPKVDTIVIVSGDGDFADLVRYLQFSGVKVEVYAFPTSASFLLRESADVFCELGEDHFLQETSQVQRSQQPYPSQVIKGQQNV